MESVKQEYESEFAYYILKTQTQCEENDGVIVYGIQIVGSDQSAIIQDVSSDEQKVKHLLHKLIINQIRPDLLYEYVEDFLGEHFCDFVLAKSAN